MDVASGKGMISSFTSSMLQKQQVSHVVEVLTDVARMLVAIVEWPLIHQALFEGISWTSQRHHGGCYTGKGPAYWLRVSYEVPTKSWKDPDE